MPVGQTKKREFLKQSNWEESAVKG